MCIGLSKTYSISQPNLRYIFLTIDGVVNKKFENIQKKTVYCVVGEKYLKKILIESKI